MYLSFFGLTEKPFSITPDPRYLYLGGRHAEALAHLVYGITEAGGFIQLTGEVGTGKTTVIRSLLARQPDNAEIALILNPGMNVSEFVLTICEELGIGMPDSAGSSVKEQVDILNAYLLKAHAAGRRVVLIVDEAQNLSAELLEQVRLLTNLETATQKLLQIILIGQPELRDMLARNDLRQLAQRITGRYHLDPLSREEAAAYIKHRLRIAGATTEIFTSGALAEMYRVSGGVPRLLNVIGDRALLGGYSEDRHVINAALVRKAASEVFGHRVLAAWLPWAGGLTAATVLATATFLVWSYRSQLPPPDPVAERVSATDAAATAVQQEPVPAAPAPLPDLASLLQAAAADSAGAWPGLFARWQATYAAGGEDACLQAQQQALDCLAATGGIEALRRYNRPAIVSIEDDAGEARQLLVTALDVDSVELAIAQAHARLPVEQLASRWNGEFLLLWKPSQPVLRSLSLGMHGEDVAALRTDLRRWAGLAPDTQAPVLFDDSLQQLVLQFQRRNGLVADGVAGRHTLVVLDAALASTDSPLLSTVVP